MLIENCIFCKIIEGSIPSNKVYEDEDVIVINDINPQAKIHCLVITKKHIKDITMIPENDNILQKIYKVINSLQEKLGLLDGFRVVTNIGVNGAQSVPHLHFHIIGGEKLSETINIK